MKTQIFHKVKYDLKGHWRSQKAFFVFKNQLFLKYLFCLTILTKFCMTVYIIKTLFFKIWCLISKVIKGQIRPFMFIYLVQIISRGNSCSLSLSSPLLLLISLYASLSFLSLSFFSSLSLFSTPPPPLHRPYIHPMPLYLLSLPPSSSLFF